MDARGCGESVWPKTEPGRSGAITGPWALSSAMVSVHIDALPAMG
ncbi:hypothetical protein [Microtetraspora sp. NBRC 13810]|nr:hypothetical protein [Microtetraspora sp. NBRC 13810]